jgi:hypothetical protein
MFLFSVKQYFLILVVFTLLILLVQNYATDSNSIQKEVPQNVVTKSIDFDGDTKKIAANSTMKDARPKIVANTTIVDDETRQLCSLQWTELNSKVFFRPQMTYYYVDSEKLDLNFLV